MTMTNKLANQLMETLMCLALSATGGVDVDNINQEQLDYADNYARTTFCDLLESWEELFNKKWQIEKE